MHKIKGDVILNLIQATEGNPFRESALSIRLNRVGESSALSSQRRFQLLYGQLMSCPYVRGQAYIQAAPKPTEPNNNVPADPASIAPIATTDHSWSGKTLRYSAGNISTFDKTADHICQTDCPRRC